MVDVVTKKRKKEEDERKETQIKQESQKIQAKLDPADKALIAGGGQIVRDTATGEVKSRLSSQEVQNLIALQSRGGAAISPGVADREAQLRGLPSQAETQKLQAETAQLQGTLTEGNVFQPEPTRQDLSPSEPLTDISGAQGVIPALKAPVLKDLFQLGSDIGALETSRIKGFSELPPEQAHNLMRIEAQNQINEKQRLSSITRADEFGALIESIPGGAFAGQYVKGLQTPGGNVKTIISEINTQKELIGKLGSDPIDPSIALSSLNTTEAQIDELEARIQDLINFSPALRRDPDQVHKIEQEILNARTEIFLSRQKIGQRAAAGIEATDEQLFIKLQELNEGGSDGKE